MTIVAFTICPFLFFIRIKSYKTKAVSMSSSWYFNHLSPEDSHAILFERHLNDLEIPFTNLRVYSGFGYITTSVDITTLLKTNFKNIQVFKVLPRGKQAESVKEYTQWTRPKPTRRRLSDASSTSSIISTSTSEE